MQVLKSWQERCISEEQYNLLIEARDYNVESAYSLSEKWEPIKDFLYVSEYMPVHCSYGIKEEPWIWSVNEQGLCEIERYEKLRDKHAQSAAKKRSEEHKKSVDQFFIPILVTVIGGLILLFIQHICPPS